MDYYIISLKHTEVQSCLDDLPEGGVLAGALPYVEQIVITWGLYAHLTAFILQFAVLAVYYISYMIIAFLKGELHLAGQMGVSLIGVGLDTVGRITLQVRAAAYEIFKARFGIFFGIWNIALMFFSPAALLKKGWSWLWIKKKEPKVTKTKRIKMDEMILPPLCVLCNTDYSIWEEYKKPENHFCSESCAYLNYNGTKK